VKNTSNFVREEIDHMYVELSCAFHDNLSKGVVPINIPPIWVLDIKFIVIPLYVILQPLIFTMVNFGVGFGWDRGCSQCYIYMT
jgi:hypothetical protein